MSNIDLRNIKNVLTEDEWDATVEALVEYARVFIPDVHVECEAETLLIGCPFQDKISASVGLRRSRDSRFVYEVCSRVDSRVDPTGDLNECRDIIAEQKRVIDAALDISSFVEGRKITRN